MELDLGSDLSFDLDSVEAAKPFVPWAGTYEFAVDAATIKIPAETDKNPVFSATLNVSTDDGERTVFWTCGLTVKSMPFFKQFLLSIYDEPPASLSLNSQEERDEFCESLTGATGTATFVVGPEVTEGKHKGKRFTKVDSFHPREF